MNRTKQAIAESLKHLLVKKPLGKITINDIAADCGISRMTFYYHFRDIYDLVEWVCVEDARRALSAEHAADGWEQAFVALLNAFVENKSLTLSVYRSDDKLQIEQTLVRMTESFLNQVIDEQSEGLSLPAETKRRIVTFLTFGFLGITMDWIEQGMKEPPEAVAAMTARIIEGEYHHFISGDFSRAIAQFGSNSK